VIEFTKLSLMYMYIEQQMKSSIFSTLPNTNYMSSKRWCYFNEVLY